MLYEVVYQNPHTGIVERKIMSECDIVYKLTLNNIQIINKRQVYKVGKVFM